MWKAWARSGDEKQDLVLGITRGIGSEVITTMHINCMHSAGAVFDFDRLGLGSRAEGGAVVPAFCVGFFF
jgi:hypothetical protein